MRTNGTRARSASEGRRSPAIHASLSWIARLPVACAPGSCLLMLFLTACGQPQHANEKPDNQDVEEHRDQWRPREAQSDFLDIGKQAGIEWLSFVPQDQLEYPEYFEGLDRDQKRRLRLAPKGSDEQVLLQFDLPEGSKLWPVDWYGTELMAVDESEVKGFSIALARDPGGQDTDRHIAESLAEERAKAVGPSAIVYEWHWKTWQVHPDSKPGTPLFSYSAQRLKGRTGSWIVVAEWSEAQSKGSLIPGPEVMWALAGSISIKRELALEGSPKHKCSSSLEEQLRGTLRFPVGTLQLPIENGQLVRKIGGDSTIQIDGEGAKPWILIRRLKEADTEGDLRARLRRDTTFNRRLKVPSAKFSTGYVPQDAKLPIVVFDYDDSSSENNLLGVLKAGNELLTFEVITQGVTDGDKRRAAKAAALKLLAGATGKPETQAPEFKPLIGWNAGDMGSGG